MLDEEDDKFTEISGENELCNELRGDFENWEPPYHGLTREDYFNFFEKNHPTASQWKDGADSKHDDIFVTVDEGSHAMRSQAKAEINFIKKKLKSILGTDSPKMIDLFNLMFGPRSRLGRLLQEKLEISFDELFKRLGLFLLASAYNFSKTQIFHKQSLVCVDGLASEEEYQNFWSAIGESGVTTERASREFGDATHTHGVMPLWIEIQNAFNNTNRELFIEGFESFLRIILDDDKMHDSSKNQNIYCLKKAQHVRDIRTGCIAPTLVYTATGLPIGIEWERASDDSTTAATERLIRSQLAPMQGDTGPPNLTNSLFAMDRGYIVPRLFYEFLVPSGAEIMGTVKICPFFPFTFDQDLKPSDPRQLVPVKGQKALLLKNLKISTKQISGFAYRDGNGSVTLGINSMIRSREWDLVTFDPKDAGRFRMPIRAEGSERVEWFQEIDAGKTRSSDFDELFFDLSIRPLTIEQATPEWFLLRMFSCTSSSTDHLLVELKKVVNSYAALIDPAVSVALHNVLTTVHGAGWNRRYFFIFSSI